MRRRWIPVRSLCLSLAVATGLLMAAPGCGDDEGDSNRVADAAVNAPGALDGTATADGAQTGDGAAATDSGSASDGASVTAVDSREATDGSATGDAALADGRAASDTSSADSASGDAEAADAMVVLPPGAPAISAPTADQEVFGQVAVSGTGEAGTAVSAQVLLGSAVIGTTVAVVDSGGDFSVTVTYLGADDDDALTLEVRLGNEGGLSPPAAVALKHTAPRALSGTVVQTGGSTNGDAVYVRLYASNDEADLLNHIGEVRLTATPSVLLTETPFSFSVGDGTFYLRAFRDAGGRGGAPDGQPTLQTDPQAPLWAVVVSGGNSTGNPLTLDERVNKADQYRDFDVVARHESVVPSPPDVHLNDTRLVGEGLCRGYYMHMRVRREGNVGPRLLSVPRVRLPGGEIVQLLDDGGCGDVVRNNTSQSYDREHNDEDYSRGIPEPGEDDAGDYTFFYEQTGDGFIHIEVDNVASVVRLPFLREVTSPTGATGNTDLTPTVSWNAVSGASAYEVFLFQEGGGSSGFDDPNRFVTSTSYTPSTPITDDACYGVTIEAYDADPRGDGDVDAYSRGSDNSFCTDVDGQQLVTVSGNIINNSGVDAPIMIRAETDNGNHQATVRLPVGSTSYSVKVIKAGSAEENGQIDAFLDAAGTGDDESPLNDNLETDARLDLTADAQHDLVFNPPILLSSPERDATVASLSPAFSWQDYAQTAGDNGPDGPFVYGIFVQPDGVEGIPPLIFGVPSTTTSLDLSALPPGTEAVDVVAIASCEIEGEGTVSANASGKLGCSKPDALVESLTTLAPDSRFSWGVVVIGCDWATYDPPNISEFVDCLKPALNNAGGLIAMSEERSFRTP